VSNFSMQRTALRAAADAGRWADIRSTGGQIVRDAFGREGSQVDQDNIDCVVRPWTAAFERMT